MMIYILLEEFDHAGTDVRGVFETLSAAQAEGLRQAEATRVEAEDSLARMREGAYEGALDYWERMARPVDLTWKHQGSSSHERYQEVWDAQGSYPQDGLRIESWVPR